MAPIVRLKLLQSDVTVRLPMASFASDMKDWVVVTDCIPLLPVTMVKLNVAFQTFHVPFINQL